MMQTSEQWELRFLLLPRQVRDVIVQWVEECAFGVDRVYELVDELLLRQGRDPRAEIKAFAVDAASLLDHFQLWSLLTAVMFFERIAPQLQTLDERLDAHCRHFSGDGVNWPEILRAIQRADAAREDAVARGRERTHTEVWNDLAVHHMSNGQMVLSYLRRTFAGPMPNQAAELIALLVRHGGAVPFAEAARIVEPAYVDYQGSLPAFSTVSRQASTLLRTGTTPWTIVTEREPVPGLHRDVRLVRLVRSSGPRRSGRPRKP